jgi:hypothetical protein
LCPQAGETTDELPHQHQPQILRSIGPSTHDDKLKALEMTGLRR